jgi:DNA-3-methyladenine glycosylase I
MQSAFAVSDVHGGGGRHCVDTPCVDADVSDEPRGHSSPPKPHAISPQVGVASPTASRSGDTVGIMTREPVTSGDDGVIRCGWVSDDPEYRRYHDEEWGTPLHGDRELFETIALEGFQAGLSWITILKRRSAFRSAFEDFSIDVVARFDDVRVDELAADPSIIRNRQKIRATITNAQAIASLIARDTGALDRLVWNHAPQLHARPKTVHDVLSTTAESVALSAALRAIGLTFVGPTTMHALMQAAGLVNDHAVGCARGDRLEESVR